MFIDVYRCLQMFVDVYRCLQMFTDVYRCLQMFIGIYSNDDLDARLSVRQRAAVPLWSVRIDRIEAHLQ